MQEILFLSDNIVKVQAGYCFGLSRWVFLGIVLMVIACFLIYLMIADNAHTFSGWALSIVFIGIFIYSFFWKPVYKEVHEYQAMISNEMPINHVTDHFDIISRTDNIYILRDKIQ